MSEMKCHSHRLHGLHGLHGLHDQHDLQNIQGSQPPSLHDLFVPTLTDSYDTILADSSQHLVLNFPEMIQLITSAGNYCSLLYPTRIS